MTDLPTGDNPSGSEMLASPDPMTVIESAGFDPSQVKAIIVTPTSITAISLDYPEPHVQPEEASE